MTTSLSSTAQKELPDYVFQCTEIARTANQGGEFLVTANVAVFPSLANIGIIFERVQKLHTQEQKQWFEDSLGSSFNQNGSKWTEIQYPLHHFKRISKEDLQTKVVEQESKQIYPGVQHLIMKIEKNEQLDFEIKKILFLKISEVMKCYFPNAKDTLYPQ